MSTTHGYDKDSFLDELFPDLGSAAIVAGVERGSRSRAQGGPLPAAPRVLQA